MTKKEVGHNFLARLGKKRLRPGGITATNWLIEQGQPRVGSRLQYVYNLDRTGANLRLFN